MFSVILAASLLYMVMYLNAEHFFIFCSDPELCSDPESTVFKPVAA